LRKHNPSTVSYGSYSQLLSQTFSRFTRKGCGVWWEEEEEEEEEEKECA